MILIPAWWLTRSKVEYRRCWVYDLMDKGLAYEIPCRVFRGGAMGDLCWLVMFKKRADARKLMMHLDPKHWVTHTSKAKVIDKRWKKLRESGVRAGVIV